MRKYSFIMKCEWTKYDWSYPNAHQIYRLIKLLSEEQSNKIKETNFENEESVKQKHLQNMHSFKAVETSTTHGTHQGKKVSRPNWSITILFCVSKEKELKMKILEQSLSLIDTLNYRSNTGNII